MLEQACPAGIYSQKFDDSLNSAIRISLSHFAAFFIDARTKRRAVKSFYYCKVPVLSLPFFPSLPLCSTSPRFDLRSLSSSPLPFTTLLFSLFFPFAPLLFLIECHACGVVAHFSTEHSNASLFLDLVLRPHVQPRSNSEPQPYEQRCLQHPLFVCLIAITMAEALGLAASVIAVIDLSAKVASRCSEYYANVKNAPDDIERLQREAQGIKATLERIQSLCDGPNGVMLQESQSLREGVKDCQKQLAQLETKLEPRTTNKLMSRYGIRALRWPLKSKEVDRITKKLGNCKDNISFSLQVDQE
jgi:hypothetical protein